jgi:hypothetical protein
MGKWIAETTLYWYEPKVIVHRRLAQTWKIFPWRLWMLGALLITIAVWATNGSSLQFDTLSSKLALCAAVGKGTLFAGMPLLILFLHRVLPSMVKVTDQGIYGGGSGWTLLKDLDRCELEILELGSRRVAVVNLILRSGGKSLKGVGENVPLRQLEEALRKNGIPVDRHPSARSY